MVLIQTMPEIKQLKENLELKICKYTTFRINHKKQKLNNFFTKPTSSNNKNSNRLSKELEKCDLSKIDNSTHTVDLSDSCLKDTYKIMQRHTSKLVIVECMDYIDKLA